MGGVIVIAIIGLGAWLCYGRGMRHGMRQQQMAPGMAPGMTPSMAPAYTPMPPPPPMQQFRSPVFAAQKPAPAEYVYDRNQNASEIDSQRANIGRVELDAM